jgi:hypothetical protein
MNNIFSSGNMGNTFSGVFAERNPLKLVGRVINDGEGDRAKIQLAVTVVGLLDTKNLADQSPLPLSNFFGARSRTIHECQ